MPGNDTIIYNTLFDKMLESMPDGGGKVFADMMESVGLNRSEIVLLHEGDHAARMYGLEMEEIGAATMVDGDMVVDPTALDIAIGCFEEHAMERANKFRAEEGMPLRTDYGMIDEQIEMLVDSIKASGQLDTMQAEGMESFMHNMLTREFTMIEARSSSCASPPTVEEVKARGEERVAALLERLEVAVIPEPEHDGEEPSLMDRVRESIETINKEASTLGEDRDTGVVGEGLPAHGLPAQATSPSQQASAARPI
jgi:hypothetical protein